MEIPIDILDCYWCFRNASDCGDSFGTKLFGGYRLQAKLDACKKCEGWRASGFKTVDYFGNGVIFLPWKKLPALEVNFDIPPTGEILPDDWAIDSGLPFGARAQRAQYTESAAGSSDTSGGGDPLEYGWNCDVQDDAWFRRDSYLTPDNIMNESYIHRLDWECPSAPGTAKTWTLKVSSL